jgi:hypothetical protein
VSSSSSSSSSKRQANDVACERALHLALELCHCHLHGVCCHAAICILYVTNELLAEISCMSSGVLACGASHAGDDVCVRRMRRSSPCILVRFYHG